MDFVQGRKLLLESPPQNQNMIVACVFPDATVITENTRQRLSVPHQRPNDIPDRRLNDTPESQSKVAFTVRHTAPVMLRDTPQRSLIPGFPEWNVENPAAVAQAIDIPGTSASRVNNDENPPAVSQPIDIPGTSESRFNDDVEFEVGSYRPSCPLRTYRSRATTGSDPRTDTATSRK